MQRYRSRSKSFAMAMLAALSLLLSGTVFSNDSHAQTESSDSRLVLKILAYNVFLRPTTLECDGQRVRAAILPAHLVGYDVIVFSEAFDDEARSILLQGLFAKGYQYTSGILGKDHGTDQDGGVILVSRYPIEDPRQFIFPRPEHFPPRAGLCLGWDCKAQKGVLYAKVNKNGKRYHIFASHTQASYEDSLEATRLIRELQFAIIKVLIDLMFIPRTEPVIIAGDLNTDKYDTVQFNSMLGILDASHPEARGHSYTYDPSTNDLARRDGGSRREYLDYVLLSNKHKLPFAASTFVEARVFRSSDPYEFECLDYSRAPDLGHMITIESTDLSDHYAVFGKISYDYSWLVPVLF